METALNLRQRLTYALSHYDTLDAETRESFDVLIQDTIDQLDRLLSE